MSKRAAYKVDDDHPLYLTQRWSDILDLIYKAKKPETATDIGCALGIPARKASASVNRALAHFVDIGIVDRFEVNQRVITYSPAMTKKPAVKVWGKRSTPKL